jgi:hypothetical protein
MRIGLFLYESSGVQNRPQVDDPAEQDDSESGREGELNDGHE